MTEQPEPYHTALTDLVHQRRTDTSVAKQSNHVMYTQLLSETSTLLGGTEQLTQDVLHQVCVEHNSKPTEVLMLVHDFLETFQAFQWHEQQPEQVEQSPFIAREEQGE